MECRNFFKFYPKFIPLEILPPSSQGIIQFPSFPILGNFAVWKADVTESLLFFYFR